MGIPISRGVWEIGNPENESLYPAAAGEQLIVGNGISEMGIWKWDLRSPISHEKWGMGLESFFEPDDLLNSHENWERIQTSWD